MNVYAPRLWRNLLALPMKYWCPRFGTSLRPKVIAAYVDRIDFGHGAVFGVHGHRRVLVGAVHVAFEGDLAELGLSASRRTVATAFVAHCSSGPWRIHATVAYRGLRCLMKTRRSCAWHGDSAWTCYGDR